MQYGGPVDVVNEKEKHIMKNVHKVIHSTSKCKYDDIETMRLNVELRSVYVGDIENS